MDAYVAEIRKLENKFSGLEIHHVIRDNNVAADVLSKLGSDRAEVPPGIFVHGLHHPSINTSIPMVLSGFYPTDCQISPFNVRVTILAVIVMVSTLKPD